MTGFQNTDYTTRANRFYQGGGSAKSSTRPAGESASKSSFAERMAAQRQQEQGGQETTAELSGMNVISGEDVKRQFAHKMPPCTSMVMPAYRDLNPYSGGNYLEKLQKELKETEYILSMINAGKCSVSPAVSLEAVREFYKEEQEYQKKMAEIFRQLQTGTSRKESASGTEKP